MNCPNPKCKNEHVAIVWVSGKIVGCYCPQCDKDYEIKEEQK